MQLRSIDHVRLDSFSVALMTDLLEEAGEDPSRILEDCGLIRDDLWSPDKMITGHQEIKFQQRFVAATQNRRDIWVKLGLRYRLPSMNPWGHALLTAPNVLTMFEMIAQFSDLTYSLSVIEHSAVDAGTYALRYSFAGVPEDIVSFVQCRDMIGATNLLHESLGNGCFPFQEIRTPLSEDYFSGFDFRANVRFNAEEMAFLWPAAIAETPLFLSDAAIHRAYMRKAQARLCGVRPRDPLLDRIEALLEQRNGMIPLPELAARMDLSVRALQRRLAVLGVSARQIVSQHRRAAAERLLLQTPGTIGDIADQLGFNDQMTFSRTFKGWTGMSPSAFRRHSWTSLHSIRAGPE